MINKRSKASRQRGHKTHGYGSMKKNRGAGNRGGRGNAGSGKRGDAKKPSFWKNKKYMGKYGFKKKGIKKEINPINFITIESMLPEFLEKKVAVEKNGVYEIDLGKAGFNKVLSQGKIINKMNIKVDSATQKSIEKIKEFGGSIEVLSETVKKEENSEN